MDDSFKIISRNVILKAPIKVIYGENNYSKYSYNQTLKEVEDEDLECEIIKSIKDKYFTYKKEGNWFRKRIS